MFFTKKRPYYHNKWILTGFIIVLFLILLRIILATIIVTVANKKLENKFSNFAFHIEDIDLKILRGVYTVKGISGMLKPSGETFLNIEEVITDISWKGILKGLIITDIFVDKMNLIASQELIDKAKSEQEKNKSEVNKEGKGKKESALRVRRFELSNSQITIENFMSLKGHEKRKITDLNVQATNLVPTQKSPITNFNLDASIFGPAPLKVVGQIKLDEKPPQWDLNAEMKEFDLRTINPFVREKVRAFIRKGKMDFYAEAKSQNGKIEGYAKPFITNLKMDTPKEGFKFKGEAAKDGGILVKQLLTDSEEKTLATKVPFEYKNKIKIEVLPALAKAVEYKVKENIPPGIDDSIGRKGLGIDEGLKQAQEEK